MIILPHNELERIKYFQLSKLPALLLWVEASHWPHGRFLLLEENWGPLQSYPPEKPLWLLLPVTCRGCRSHPEGHFLTVCTEGCTGQTRPPPAFPAFLFLLKMIDFSKVPATFLLGAGLLAGFLICMMLLLYVFVRRDCIKLP